MPEYLTVADFLAYGAQMTRKIGRVNDNVDTVREQVNSLATIFKTYIAETGSFRLETNKRLDRIESRLDSFEQTVNSRFDVLEQTMNCGFALIFTHLGIQP